MQVEIVYLDSVAFCWLFVCILFCFFSCVFVLFGVFFRFFSFFSVFSVFFVFFSFSLFFFVLRTLFQIVF